MNVINLLLENLIKEKVYSQIKDNIWGGGGGRFSDMQSLSRKNKGINIFYVL